MPPHRMNTLPTPPVSPEVLSTGMKRSLDTRYSSRPTPLRMLWRSVYERRMDVKALKRYLHRHQHLDINDARGFSVFYHACRTSSIDAMQYLLNLSQIDINKRYGPLQAAVLHASVCVGSAATIDLLLKQNNINVNLTTVNGHTPLHIAALVKSVVATEKLLAAGADPTLTDHCGHTPLHLAISQGSMSTVKCLLANKSPTMDSQHPSTTTKTFPPLTHAIALGHYPIMCELINAGEDINKRDHLNRTPLDVAITFQRYDCMSYLVDCGAQQSITHQDSSPPEMLSSAEKPKDIRQLMSLEFWTSPSPTM